MQCSFDPCFSICGLKLFPDGDRKILRTGELAFHKVHIQVQVAGDRPFLPHVLYQVAQCFGVENKPVSGFGSPFMVTYSS